MVFAKIKIPHSVAETALLSPKTSNQMASPKMNIRVHEEDHEKCFFLIHKSCGNKQVKPSISGLMLCIIRKLG